MSHLSMLIRDLSVYPKYSNISPGFSMMAFTAPSFGPSYPVLRAPGILCIPRAVIYFLATIYGFCPPVLLAFLSMFGAVCARGSAFEGPTLSSRRLQNVTQADGTVLESIAGIFSNDFGKACRDEYIEILDNTTGFDQLGSSAATTVMTLVPAMIVFAAIPMASIKSLNFLNTQLALFTSAMTLGMKIETRDTVDRNMVKRVTDLCSADFIEDSGRAMEPYEFEQMYNEGELTKLRGTLQKPRPKILYTVSIMLAYNLLQVLLFGTLVRALPKIENILFIWTCPNESALIYNAWLGVTAMLSAVIRTFGISAFAVKEDEVILISPLSTKNYSHCQECSAMAREPKPETPWDRIKGLSSIRPLHLFSLNPGIISIIIKYTVIPYRLPHPMIVVLRYSSESSPQKTIKLAIYGLIQAISIVLLTFMFASMWGGSVMWTTLFVAGFMCIIWVSRTASLIIGEYLERQTGMTVILFNTGKERAAMLRVLAAMPGALVKSRSHGYKYWDGHNIAGGCTNHQSEYEKNVDMETKVRAAGFLSGIVIGLLAGFGVFLGFFLATLPYNAPFLPHPRTWLDYPVAFIVSTIIAAAFWVNYATQKSQFLLWGYLYHNIRKSPMGMGDVEAVTGNSPVLVEPKS